MTHDHAGAGTLEAPRTQSKECARCAATIVVPVNAQGDLDNVRALLGDLAGYGGPHALEIILVVNNFPPDAPPAALTALTALGARVLAIPNVRKPGEAVAFSARIPGVRAASAPWVIFFDADCRIPNPTALIDWYVEQHESGARAAYTSVKYVDYPDALSVHVQCALHHLFRWGKRNVLRIPTTQGCDYAVEREAMLDLYDRGMLADEMNVGPTMKRLKGRVTYSGRKELKVVTSGRMWRAGWSRLPIYIFVRLRYNLRVLPVRQGVAQRTGRERDPVRRFVDNRPIR